MSAASHPHADLLFANEEREDTHDDDPSNMFLRAGYLAGVSLRFEVGSHDRKMLQRAARSLVRAAQSARVADRDATLPVSGPAKGGT